MLIGRYRAGLLSPLVDVTDYPRRPAAGAVCFIHNGRLVNGKVPQAAQPAGRYRANRDSAHTGSDGHEFRAVLEHGNAVGSHSLTHPEFHQLTAAAARRQLVETARIMAKAGNYRTRIWRTPYQGGDQPSVGNGMFSTLVGQQLGFT